jgi:hypothetical protein
VNVSRLDLEIDESSQNHPAVRVIIDGSERLRTSGEERSSPDGLLASGALLPRDPPRRIAFYGCGCGEFGCSTVAGLVAREGGLVTWRDFRTVTGAYGGPLPDPDDLPDPLLTPADFLGDPYGGSALDVADLAFDAEQYLTEVARAAADRSWETRAMAVCRVARDRLEGWRLLWPEGSARVAMSRDFHGADVVLALPEGDPADLVAALAGVLRTPEVEAMLAATRWTPETERRGHERRVEGASGVLTRLWAEASGGRPT